MSIIAEEMAGVSYVVPCPQDGWPGTTTQVCERDANSQVFYIQHGMGTRMHADRLTHSDTELPSLLSIVSSFSCLLLWTWGVTGPARHRVSALYLIMANPTGLGRVET